MGRPSVGAVGLQKKRRSWACKSVNWLSLSDPSVEMEKTDAVVEEF